MYKQYDPETLEKLKKVELIILKDFKRVCQKNDIKWFAIGGTLIGSVRHHGFIPWDDDLDIGMLRSDYEKFVSVFEKEMGDQYDLINPDTDPYYSSAVIKLMRKGTKFIPSYGMNSKAHYEIFMDIFVYDNYLDNKQSQKQIRQARILDMLMVVRTWSHPEIPYTGLKKQMAQAVCSIAHGGMILFHITGKKLYKKFNKVAQRYNSVKTDEITIFQDSRIHDSRIDHKELFPLKTGLFEDMEIPIPNDSMTLLKRYYGEDVMTLPPVEKRVNHAPELIDFGDVLKY